MPRAAIDRASTACASRDTHRHRRAVRAYPAKREPSHRGDPVFSSLMPQRKEFYELLAAHSDLVVAGANAVLRLMNGLGNGTEDIPRT